MLTVQILYKLYSLQLNCTYSNYTEAAATCPVAQQHSTFTVQILYADFSGNALSDKRELSEICLQQKTSYIKEFV